MFQSFTGASRRPRQVNLSGKTKNPFAQPGLASGSGSAVANAQQEREKRQQERDRLNAARSIQRTWRGHDSRRRSKQTWREQWDQDEASGGSLDIEDIQPYISEEDALLQLRRISRFLDSRDTQDVMRLLRFWRRLRSTQNSGAACTEGPWPLAYLRLQGTIISELQRLLRTSRSNAVAFSLLEVLHSTSKQIPQLLSHNVRSLYQVLTLYTTIIASRQAEDLNQLNLILQIALLPLQSTSLSAYSAFACQFLAPLDFSTQPNLLSWRDELARHIDQNILARSLVEVLEHPKYGNHQELDNTRNRSNLLGSFIYFHKISKGSSSANYVRVISALLSSIAEEVNLDELQSPDYFKIHGDNGPVSALSREEILSLVNQESIGGLLFDSSNNDQATLSDEAKQLAGYALTLLRFFPRRGDEIRMWLYLGTSASDKGSRSRPPAVKYFWQAARASKIFDTISRDSRAAINLLKAPKAEGSTRTGPTSTRAATILQDDWRLILVFFELYTFVLKLMDDNEFFANGKTGFGSENVTWAGQNALPLDDIQQLTVFLKNLGFTMYFNAKEIADDSERDSNTISISNYFSVSRQSQIDPSKHEAPPREANVAGLPGMSVEYVKGLVTGLLRMLYERDSRRKFLPKDHWLMTSRFDMTAFIPEVVEEEENRHRVQEEDDADTDQVDVLMQDDQPHLIGTGREQRVRQIEELQRQQRKASRKRFLQSVAPRLEILQNMPFFIPFDTRVKIFREFVHRDQVRRRNGYLDAETWRMAMMHDPRSEERGISMLQRHQGQIRRGHEFDDAFEHFYGLGEALKEPIQITFVDRFDQPEAGIDGGGVTKEFLTSVTGEAFKIDEHQPNMFVENDQHLLYPNPAAMDEHREYCLRQGAQPGSPQLLSLMRDYRQKYEFLGRIIGKCLYEGILVDVNFAGFFLLKWALTGGAGAAPRESSYRANLNDLRDMDEGLYQGLLQLKNYPGDVEDFALNFTISETVKTNFDTGASKTITKDLKPDGANIAVTNANRLVYISYVARHRLQIQPGEQTTAFLRGLSSMIQPSWLSMFNQAELQTLLSGSRSAVDIADLRASTAYGGLYVIGDDGLEHPTIQMFWRVMENFSDEDRRAVLKFVTSTPRAPLLGFGSLRPRFSIRDSSNDEARLPSTSTCVNLLKLPVYKNEQVLREKLLYAVKSGAGFDLS